MTEEKRKPLHRDRIDSPDKNAAEELRQQKRKQLKEDCRVTFSSPAGRRVLRYLMDLAGYRKSKVGGNPALGMDVLTGTLYNSARELVVLEMLEFLPLEVRRDVEFQPFEELIE
jgi:hypothetical protein